MLKFGKLTEDSALTGKRYLQLNLNLPNCDTLKNNNIYELYYNINFISSPLAKLLNHEKNDSRLSL